MTSTKDRVSEQTGIRRSLLRNGYTPLANKAKMCLLEGWPQINPSDYDITAWSRSLAYQTTGIRIDPPLAAIDIDIDDEKLVAQLFNACADKFGEDWADSVLIRTGKGAKETWLVLSDEPFKTPPGPKYVRPEDDLEDDEADRHKVELFGGGNARQIGAFGVHTPGEGPRDEPLVEYGWLDDRSPANIPQTSLPTMTWDDFTFVMRTASDIMAAAGWQLDNMFRLSQHTGEKLYDLNRDMTFVTAGGEVSYDALSRYGGCRMKEITGDGTNVERGRIYVDENGDAFVWDSQSSTTHLLEELEPKSLDEKVGSLFKALANVHGERALMEHVEKQQHRPPEGYEDWELTAGCEGLVEWDRLERMVENFSARYALNVGSSIPRERIVDTFTGGAYGVDMMRDLYMPQSMQLETVTPAGNPTLKLFHVVDQWMKREDRQLIRGYQFTPGLNDRLIERERDGTHLLNLYTPPRFLAVQPAGDPEVLLRLIDHLLPDEEERAYLLNWIAHKVQHKSERGVGVVLINEEGGVGKNIFFRILSEVMGREFCGELPQGMLLGTSNQASFGDVLLNKVLLTTSEIAMDGEAFKMRRAAYEHFKELVDPAPQERTINRKLLSQIKSTVFYSWIGATNHTDALPIDPNDRRAAVLTCSTLPLVDNVELRQELDEVFPMGKRADPALLHAIHDWLMDIPTDRDAFMRVPDTAGREEMISSNEGVVEETLREVLSKLPEDRCLIWKGNFERMCREKLRQSDVSNNVKEHFARNASKLLRRGFDGWRTTGKTKRIRLSDGMAAGILYRDGWEELTPAERTKMLGDQT